MSTGVSSPGRAQVREKTLRQDNWWVYPLLTFLGFTAFVVYSTWRAFSGDNYYSTPYLSPFYSPCLATACVDGSSDLGQPVGDWWRLSPALIILVFPLGFRLTCYYYRKAYYRSFWLSPPACAVAEPHGKYTGETRLPLILQNIHRYFWVAAVLVGAVLTFDTILAFRNEDGEWGHMGLGTLIFLANITFIWLYTLGCHSCRHIVGGRLRHFSKHPVRYKMWGFVSKLNAKHGTYAWLSLFSVAIADLYVYLLATDTINDLRFF
ncbi:MAG TPA: hypothetical protein VJ819_16370 [Nocardioidaceae bacterium]|jgi:hypothetical protein|nr:hypothetical protein [Nocardioidaceae bacterium]